jgi:uncharacterized membrane protein
MRWLFFIARQWRLLLAALVAAAIVHIWTTLSAMQEAVVPGYTALVKDLPVNRVSFLKPLAPGSQLLPFMMPDSLYAICRFDATGSTIRLVANLPEAGWSLSLHAPNGDNYYFVPGSDARQTKLDIILQPSGATFLRIPRGGVPQTTERPKVLLPNPHGIAVLRAPIKGLAYRRMIDEQRSAFVCRPTTNTHASG